MKDYVEISSRANFSNFSEYVEDAFKFCEAYNVRIFAKQIPTRPDGIGNDWGGNKYRIVMKRSGHGQFFFYFTDSLRNMGSIPNCYDILACLDKYDPQTLEDFICEFGYEITSYEKFKEVRKTWNTCKRIFDHVSEMFPEESVYNELCEIC